MLHILLLILKIIGIILAVILGILVLLVCIVIFSPVRYEISGKYQGSLDTLKGKVKVTWLFHLVQADIYYKENVLKWRLRVAWIKKIGGQEYKDNIKEDINIKTMPAGQSGEEAEKEDKNYADQKTVDEKPEEVPKYEKIPQNDEKVGEKQEETEKEREENVEDMEKETPHLLQKHEEGDEHHHRFWKRIREKIKEICAKIKALYHRIKCTIQNLCDKIKELSGKKEQITEFIEDEIHVMAFLKVKKEIFRLLRKLRPQKLQLNAVIGFEDPVWTGRLLAGLAMVYPFWGDGLCIQPEFEQRIFKGTLYCKGHVRVLYFAAAAWNLLWSGHVRKTYKDIRILKDSIGGT